VRWIVPNLSLLAIGVFVLWAATKLFPVLPWVALIVSVVAGGLWLATNRPWRRQREEDASDQSPSDSSSSSQ